MNTRLYSFIDIFDTVFDDEQNSVKINKIVIPIIQRDYAQGRLDADVNRIRKRFLDSLYSAVTDAPTILDFIYGDIDKNGTITPLDGQQRLTTLFLLHWYAAKKENVPESEWRFLENFSYETRYSATDFCMELVKFKPTFTAAISEEIINQVWFPLEWKKDPTISSMLVMLDAINSRFKDAENIWDNLKNGAIKFYFLPIKDMGLTDELYIKMNSRGKPLTMFEHFKAELEGEIRAYDEEAAERITTKFDVDWMRVFWKYRSSGGNTADDNVTDDEFLRYFRFICDILCYSGGASPQIRVDVFDLIKRYFSKENASAGDNIKTLESYFDCWCSIPGYDNPSDFLESFMSYKHEPGRIKTGRNGIKIFEDCLHSYSDKNGRMRQFPLNRVVLLYAITTYLCSVDKISREAFTRRIRVVNNLIQNSQDEVSDRADRNRIPAILAQVRAIILTGKIDDSIENSFNVHQLAEEKEKIAFTEAHPEKAEALYQLEDHYMLNGQIGILGLEHLDYADRFAELFECDKDNIDCALMAVGDYGQKERGSRYQYASKRSVPAWRELFHRSANAGFENTSAILTELLSGHESFSDTALRERADLFIKECEDKKLFPWRYYYIKYDVFRPGSYGKLRNNSPKQTPYMFTVLQTRLYLSQNSYIPYLKAADDAHLSRDDMGQRLVYGDKYIVCTNSAYVVRENNSDKLIERIDIAQNSGGIDTEDRVIKLKTYIKTHFAD